MSTGLLNLVVMPEPSFSDSITEDKKMKRLILCLLLAGCSDEKINENIDTATDGETAADLVGV